ncbi:MULTISPECIES: barstar family protein [unclassified Isoptericola]|uniref:barstar family protein n=1 Tax=unclassified Isoptericola TaxID=2623355 RepID=UPI0036533A05
MRPMTDVVLDGTRIRTEADLHRELADQLDLGPFYGRNLAALRDRLEHDVERPVRLVWRSSRESRAQLGDALFDRVVDLLARIADDVASRGWEERFELVLE